MNYMALFHDLFIILRPGNLLKNAIFAQFEISTTKNQGLINAAILSWFLVAVY